jgi:hypothetical protein
MSHLDHIRKGGGSGLLGTSWSSDRNSQLVRYFRGCDCSRPEVRNARFAVASLISTRHAAAADPWDPMSQHVERSDTLDQGDDVAERTPPCGRSTWHRT